MVVRRRTRPPPSSRSHSSSASSSSLFKGLAGNTWIARWFRKTQRKDHSHRPPSALHLKHHQEDDTDVADKEERARMRQQVWDQSVTAFKAIISARICSAVWSHISDCDETFNYWEPAHYMLYGSGLETWEYSPLYAIRSYAFIWIYALPGLLIKTMMPTVRKAIIFVATRILLALTCTLIEVYFHRAVHHAFGSFVAKICLAIQVFSIGMTIASISFLPSTFSMYCLLVITASHLMGHVRVGIFANLLNTLIGWPFATLAAIPFIAHTTWIRRHSIVFLIKWSLIFLLLIGVPMICIDSYYYGKLVIAPVNIVAYNVLKSSGGPELYGTEPWYFYAFNLFLNFNLILICSAAAIPLFLISKLMTISSSVKMHHATIMASLILWALVFVPQGHKEERFMFPIYPLICLSAALAIEVGIELSSQVSHKLSSLCLNASLALLMASAIISISRGAALYKAFSAPIDVFSTLHPINDRMMHVMNHDFGQVNVCVGKEWHRFPSSFFLPDEKWKLKFLKSNFAGQLPSYFDEGGNGTRVIPANMNDRNREEVSRYVDLKECHFVIDTNYSEHRGHDVAYVTDPNLEVVGSVEFLDSSRTPFPYRSFYVPFLFDKKWIMINYNIMKNVNTTSSFPIQI